MKTPKRLQPLIDDGMIDEVIRPLMSGKEADVYMVRCGSEFRCAKVYKEVNKRGFRKASEYREERKVRNTRRARAMDKGSKFGRHEREQIWQNAEVDALFLLARVGVRVPEPYGCYSGVLLMELLLDKDGEVAPRLNDITLSKEEALEDHALMIRYVTRMLCAGVIHGDLSEFNVLMERHGPVIIDLPQAVDAAANNNAQRMFERDVNSITRYYGQFAPELMETRYAKEIWALYKEGELHPESELTGLFQDSEEEVDVDAVLEEIEAAFLDEQERREKAG